MRRTRSVWADFTDRELRDRLAAQERSADCPSRVLAEVAKAKAEEIRRVLRMRELANIKRQKALDRLKARNAP